MTRLLPLGVIAVFVLAGCASPRGIVPDRPLERYGLPSWPRQSITLEVADARDRNEGSAGLVEVTRAILSEALAVADAPPGPPRQLLVEIMVHDVALHGPAWIATTRFRATLIEDGRAVRTWDARAEERRINWVPADARTAAQEAYQRALAGLVARLEQAPP